jgi:hypothetical protein
MSGSAGSFTHPLSAGCANAFKDYGLPVEINEQMEPLSELSSGSELEYEQTENPKTTVTHRGSDHASPAGDRRRGIRFG